MCLIETSGRRRGAPRYVAGTALFLTAIVGCGKPAYQLDTAPVHGRVMLDGQPLPSGYVVVPTPRGRMASGEIQPDGTFVLTTYETGDGVQVGTHPVVVNEVPPDEFAQGPPKRQVPIPERYTRAGTSGLKVEVKPGETNYLELTLTTDEAKKAAK